MPGNMKDGFFCELLSRNSLFLAGLIKHKNRTKCQVGFAEILVALIVWIKFNFVDIPARLLARVLFCFHCLPNKGD